MLLPKRGTDILQGGFNQRDELTARADAEQGRLSDRRRTTLGRLAGRQTRVVPMDTGDLRPCPFCRYDKPRLALFGNEEAQILVVTCPECGAVGPRSTGDDPPGHAAHLWNQGLGRTIK